MGTRTFALVAGAVYILVGLLGFIPGVNQTPPADHGHTLAVDVGYGYLLGIFPINILHNVVHLAVGALGVASYGSWSTARGFARGLAVFYAVLAVMGLIPALDTTFGLIPIFGSDVWLHALTSLVAAYFGFVHQDETDRVSTSR